jgi:2-polyprenyl-3-methyl-5-hydroxy-6-metoxy-1,4-benzoquinol methylase
MADLLFDEPYYLAINEARWPVFERMLAAVRRSGDVGSILDAGCGPGWFAERLAATGLDVLAVDGRPELIEEGRLRAPAAQFDVFDFDGAALESAPAARDAVFAFGLLYHLENPLRALRLCRATARKALFLETMTIPEPGRLARLVQENPNETQGLRNLALVLTPDAIVSALFYVGFKYVYRYVAPVDHADFADTDDRRKRRDIFLACEFAVADEALEECVRERLGRYDYTKPRPG